MKTVGELLKTARLRKGITLEEAEVATKIRMKYLKALEEDEWQKLPSLAYTRGFIKNYADFLEENQDLVMATFRRQKQPNIEKSKIILFSH